MTTASYDPTVDGSVTFLHPLDVKENPNNPRVISDERFTALKYALERAPKMLLARPVIVDTDGLVIGGNKRLRAAREMIGDEQYPDFNEWVREHHGIPFFVREFESDAERREWLLRDNQEYGEYVPEELAAILKLHEQEGGDVSLTGFTGEDFSAIIKAADAGQGDGGGSAGESVPDVWGVVVECETEAQQAELLEELADREGLSCRALL